MKVLQHFQKYFQAGANLYGDPPDSGLPFAKSSKQSFLQGWEE